ncbi:MAG: hypothetical protein KC766_33865 [Myxococcales bacterium]|nr:hypothetical protein [Myxococcales bacterium]
MKRRSVALALALAWQFAAAESRAETSTALVAHVDARVAAFDGAPRFDARQQLSVGTEVRGLLAPEGVPLAYLAGVGYQFGVASPLGFLYDVHLLPLGLGFDLGDSGLIGVFGGGRLSGVTARVPPSASGLVELRSELALGNALVGSLWVAASGEGNSARRDGAPSLGFVDEFSSGIAVRFGELSSDWQGHAGAGLFVGALYLERGGARGAGLLLGHGLNTFGGGF